MSEPFIFIGTHSIREGKLQNLKQYEQELVALVEANEPRLIAFHIFVNEDGTQATTIQVHPDAASMAFHMQVIGQKISERMRSWSGPNASRSMERPATRSWR